MIKEPGVSGKYKNWKLFFNFMLSETKLQNKVLFGYKYFLSAAISKLIAIIFTLEMYPTLSIWGVINGRELNAAWN